MPPRKVAGKSAVAKIASSVKTTATVAGKGVTAKVVTSSKSKVVEKKSVPAKRAVPEDDGDLESDSSAEKEAKRPAKKQKKASGKATDMALAERTAIKSLKKSMFIGAHVSSAGGT